MYSKQGLATVILLILLIPLGMAISSDVEKSKWDLVSVSPNHLDFTKPECQNIELKPTFRMNSSAEIGLSIYGEEYANGVSTSAIFKVSNIHFNISEDEVRKVIICADYLEPTVPDGEYTAVLYVETPDRVYQVPLTLTTNSWQYITSNAVYMVKSSLSTQLLLIPLPDGSVFALLGVHLIILILVILVIAIIWILAATQH